MLGILDFSWGDSEGFSSSISRLDMRLLTSTIENSIFTKENNMLVKIKVNKKTSYCSTFWDSRKVFLLNSSFQEMGCYEDFLVRVMETILKLQVSHFFSFPLGPRRINISSLMGQKFQNHGSMLKSYRMLNHHPRCHSLHRNIYISI